MYNVCTILPTCILLSPKCCKLSSGPAQMHWWCPCHIATDSLICRVRILGSLNCLELGQIHPLCGYQTMLWERYEKGPTWQSTGNVCTHGPLLRVDSLLVFGPWISQKVCYLDIVWQEPEAQQLNASFTQRQKESFDLERGASTCSCLSSIIWQTNTLIGNANCLQAPKRRLRLPWGIKWDCQAAKVWWH